MSVASLVTRFGQDCAVYSNAHAVDGIGYPKRTASLKTATVRLFIQPLFIQPASGRERQLYLREAPELTHMIYGEASVDIVPSDEIRYSSRVFSVLAVRRAGELTVGPLQHKVILARERDDS